MRNVTIAFWILVAFVCLAFGGEKANKKTEVMTLMPQYEIRCAPALCDSLNERQELVILLNKSIDDDYLHTFSFERDKRIRELVKKLGYDKPKKKE